MHSWDTHESVRISQLDLHVGSWKSVRPALETSPTCGTFRAWPSLLQGRLTVLPLQSEGSGRCDFGMRACYMLGRVRQDVGQSLGKTDECGRILVHSYHFNRFHLPLILRDTNQKHGSHDASVITSLTLVWACHAREAFAFGKY